MVVKRVFTQNLPKGIHLCISVFKKHLTHLSKTYNLIPCSDQNPFFPEDFSILLTGPTTHPVDEDPSLLISPIFILFEITFLNLDRPFNNYCSRKGKRL